VSHKPEHEGHDLQNLIALHGNVNQPLPETPEKPDNSFQ
jgi:hypothetical protein